MPLFQLRQAYTDEKFVFIRLNQHSSASNGVVAVQFVVLLRQIKPNAMALSSRNL